MRSLIISDDKLFIICSISLKFFNPISDLINKEKFAGDGLVLISFSKAIFASSNRSSSSKLFISSVSSTTFLKTSYKVSKNFSTSVHFLPP